MITDKILLVGNGINNVNSEYTWKNLIKGLISSIGATGQISMENKPFPLLYEEIFIEAVKNRGKTEKEMKEYIASQVAKLKVNDIHKKIMALNFENLLTTNYDYTLEKAIINNTDEITNSGIINESKYSLFRHVKIGKSKIWHVHGEMNNPLSINLGYEHYSGYLQQMRNYIATGTGNSYKQKFEPLILRFKQNNITYDSWLDFFFTKKIYIIGLTLDFVEIHLWWLLTYRARRIFEKDYPIKNKIVYFYPDDLVPNIKNKIDLLKSSEVIPYSVELKKNNWEKYYLQVLDIIKNNKI